MWMLWKYQKILDWENKDCEVWITKQLLQFSKVCLYISTDIGAVIENWFWNLILNHLKCLYHTVDVYNQLKVMSF
jgi:hypothetical protein